MKRPSAPWARSHWFLTSPPQTTHSTIARPRLASRITDIMARADVAVVAAPSGYGKTVLLTAWARGRDELTAWLTLTHHEHGDEELLLLGILSALERLSGGLAPWTELRVQPIVTTDVEVRDIFGSIAGLVAGLSQGVVLVIDDAHLAGAVLSHRVIDVLAALTEGRLRFVVAGKPELLPWFAKRITSDHRVVISPAELAMSVEEVIQDAAHRGESLDVAEAEARRSLTGGWPIALQLHRLADNNTTEPIWQEALLVDFMANNVLPVLSPRVREFVLTATTCNRLDPALARALSGEEDAEALLEECIASGLFLERAGDSGSPGVYRWHDAFAEACRRIVSRSSSSRSHALDAIAARALAPRFPAEALKHAAKAEDSELTLKIIRSSWIRIIIESGARPLQSSCESLPVEFTDNPEVLIIRACCLNLLGDLSGARMLAARALSRGSGDPAFEATRAFADLFILDEQARLASALADAQALLDHGRIEPTMYADRVFLTGWTLLRLRRDAGEAARLLRTAMDEAHIARRPILEKLARVNLLFALTYAGRFTEAERLLEDGPVTGDAEGDWVHYDSGIGLFALAFGFFWQGRFDEASASLRSLVDRGGHTESYAALGRVFLALIAAAQGSPREIRDARRHIAGIGRNEIHGMPWPVYRALARAALLAAEGDRKQAITVITPLRDETNVPIVRVVAADIARQGGETALAMEFLAGLTENDLSVSYIAVAALTTASLLAHENGDKALAHRRLEGALDAAAREGVLRPFLSAEPRLRELLSAHAVAGSSHAGFIAARLAVLEPGSTGDSLGTMLSNREREILGYLRTTMTAGEIAAALFVSVNTVRTHQRAIYRKLGVTNRRDAVRLRP